jgi:hypothetical protein
MKENCLSCEKFLFCKDPNKKYDYLCSKYGPFEEVTQLFEEEEEKEVEYTWEPEKKIVKDSDLIDLVETMMKDKNPIVRDARIDDSDIPEAANFYEFTTNKNFIGGDMKPFAKQLQVGLNLFSEYCPNCSNKKFVCDIPLEASYEEILNNVQLLEHGKCPKCKARKSSLILDGVLSDHVEFCGLVGQRAGKTAVAGMLDAYTQHKFLKCKNPARLYGLLSSQTLIATYTATDFTQAKETVWDPIYNMMNDSNWFKNYHKMLKYYGDKYGEEFFSIKQEFYRYKHKRMLGYPTGPNKRALRGRTRYFGTIDEIGWFSTENSKQIRMNADEIYSAMERSFLTLRTKIKSLRRQGMDNIPTPMFINISSPSSIKDKIMRLYVDSKKSKKIYGIKYATWEFNPSIKKEDLDEEFDRSPQDANRDYACNPPRSSNAFISKLSMLKSAFSQKKKNALDVVQSRVVMGNKQVMMSGRVHYNWKNKKFQRIMALDAGYTSNSFAFCIGHIEHGICYIDGICEIIPNHDAPISHSDLYENVLLPIALDMNVRLIVSDRWQNIKILQDIQSEIIENIGDDSEVVIEQYSVKYLDFDNLRQAVFDGSIIFPKPEIKPNESLVLANEKYPKGYLQKPVVHLIHQLLSVQDFPGQSVEKSQNATDDILRCICLAHSFMNDNDYFDILEKSDEVETKRNRDVFGVVVKNLSNVRQNDFGSLPSGQTGTKVFSRN